MRRRIYVDGKPAWSDPEPSEFPEEMPRLSGSLVLGASGANDPDKRRAQVARYKAKQKAPA